MGVAGETADVVFIGRDDVELELLVDTVRDPVRCVIIETISLEKDWASVEVPSLVDWLTLGEGEVTAKDGSMLFLEV